MSSDYSCLAARSLANRVVFGGKRRKKRKNTSLSKLEFFFLAYNKLNSINSARIYYVDCIASTRARELKKEYLSD